MNGILIVDKPQSYTSFDVIAVLRKKLGQKKIGHMGTLDPMATGVLPILLGSSAKFQIFAPEQEKEYIAEIQFGISTDTLDIFGKTLSRSPTNIKTENLKTALKKFIGKINQIPPMYSAIKKNGVKLCDLARKGKVIEREPREVEIKSIELISFDEIKQLAKIKVICSKGTYIRSLCFDIGKELDAFAAMGNLQRTRSNSFGIDQALTLQTILDTPLEVLISHYILSTDCLFKNNKSANLTMDLAFKFKNGVSLSLHSLSLSSDILSGEIIKLYLDNNFLGLGKVDKENNKLKFLKCE